MRFELRSTQLALNFKLYNTNCLDQTRSVQDIPSNGGYDITNVRARVNITQCAFIGKTFDLIRTESNLSQGIHTMYTLSLDTDYIYFDIKGPVLQWTLPGLVSEGCLLYHYRVASMLQNRLYFIAIGELKKTISFRKRSLIGG